MLLNVEVAVGFGGVGGCIDTRIISSNSSNPGPVWWRPTFI